MTVKISNLPAATSVGSGDVLPVVQSGTTKKIDLNSPWSINIDGGNIDGTPIGVSSASTGAFTTLTASDDVNFDSGTLFVDASANRVGIGTTSPNRLLDVFSDSMLADLAITASTSGQSFIAFANTGDSNVGGIAYDHATNHMRFRVNDFERMRIDSSGNVLIGKTTTAATSRGYFIDQNGEASFAQPATGRAIGFVNSGTGSLVGSIVVNASSTSYNNSSDYRLKENISDAYEAGAKVDAIKVRQFDWKADGSHQDYGMIAQELLTVAPEAVSGDPESDEMMGIDYSKLVPMLVKEIQSLRARVHALESQ